MRVKMLTQECGPAGNFAPGDIRIVSPDHGAQLVAGRHAIPIADPIETATLSTGEITAPKASELAIGPESETRKQGRRSRK